MILTDQIRRQISVNTPALRIISLVPSITETLYQIGAGAQVVGRTKFCIEPARKVNSSSIVGGTKSFHRDKIDALRPDLVLANKEENDQNAIEALAQDYPVCYHQNL